MKNGLSLWNEIDDVGFGDELLLLLNKNAESGNELLMSEEKNVCREERRGRSACMLSRETISEHFYMPIAHAAKQLKVGLTPLKKSCRQLGIQRWPHRKLTSLQTLISTVQVLAHCVKYIHKANELRTMSLIKWSSVQFLPVIFH